MRVEAPEGWRPAAVVLQRCLCGGCAPGVAPAATAETITGLRWPRRRSPQRPDADWPTPRQPRARPWQLRLSSPAPGLAGCRHGVDAGGPRGGTAESTRLHSAAHNAAKSRSLSTYG